MSWHEIAEQAWDDASETPYKSRWESAVEDLENRMVDSGVDERTAMLNAVRIMRQAVGEEHEDITDPRQIGGGQ